MSQIKLEIRTFVAGALSRLGHDLAFQVLAEIHWSGSALRAEVRQDSLELSGTVQGGVLDPMTPNPSDREKIMTTVRMQVLHQGRYPEPSLIGELQFSSGVAVVSGTLSLHGAVHPVTLRAPVESSASQQVAVLEWELVPSRWGIPPFSAMLGALKLQDRVQIRGRVPLPPAG